MFLNLAECLRHYSITTNEVKERIEERRYKQLNKAINQRAQYDKTAKSKDIIIMAKDQKIKELEE